MKRGLLLMLASLLIKSVAWAAVVAGRTEGTFSVSPSGAATYQIPYDDSLHVDYYESIERPCRIENCRYRAEFKYDGNGNRIRMDVYEKRNGSFTPSFTRYYLDDNVEVTVDAYGQRDLLYYAGGDSYTAPAVLHYGEMGDSCLYQITRDPQGSVLAYDGTGGRYYRLSYTPWGIRIYDEEGDRIALPGEKPAIGPFCRTYTGHEELWMFGLINANARLYDPYSGRFISPDPLLNCEGGPLLFNPYVYANNNPCRYIDRNGEYWWIALAAVLAGGINVWTHFDAINNAGDFFKYFGVGAATGALSAVVGPSVVGALGISGAGFLYGVAAGAVTGTLSNQLQAGMNYAFLGTPYSFNWQDFIMQAAISSALGGFTSGIQAKISGKNFWTGKQPPVPSQALETPSGKIETTVTGFDRSKLEDVTKTNTLIHYTNKDGYEQIMENQILKPSLSPKHTRFGQGVYLTNIKPGELTIGQTSRRLYGVPWNKSKLGFYIELNIDGLGVVKNNVNNFMVPGVTPLDIRGRMVNSGVSYFK